MLTLTITSSPLDLYPDSSASITLLSAYFDRDRIERAFSYPLTIPATPNNLSLLEYPNRLDAKKKRKFEDARLLINNIEFERGVIVITDVSNDSIEIAFQNDGLDMTEKLQLFSMQDISDEHTATDPYTPIIYVKVPYDAAADSLVRCYIEINGTFYDEPMPTRVNIAASINADIPGLASVFYSDSFLFIMALDTSVDPDLEIRLRPERDYVQFWRPFDLHFDNSTVEAAYQTDYQTYLNGIAASPSTHAFPVIYAPNFYDGNQSDYYGYLNYYNQSADYETNQDYFTGDTWQYTIVPMMFLKSAVEKLFELIGLTTMGGDFFQDTDIQKLIVYNNKCLDENVSPVNFILDADSVASATDFNLWNGWKRTYDVGDHLPDISLYEFLQKLADTFPLMYQMRNGIAKVSSVNSLLSQKQIDLTDYIQENFAKEYSDPEGYKLSYDRQGVEQSSSVDLLDLQSGNDDDDLIEIETGFFTLYRKTILDDDGVNDERFWQVPEDLETGTSALAGTSAEIPFKLLWYFGLQDDNADNDYPFASFFPENYDGTSVGAYSLQWSGTKGLYSKWWSKYIELLQGDAIDVTLYLPVYMLLELREKLTAPVYFKHPHGSVKGVIKELKFDANTQNAELIRVDATIVKL
jgi:hypothetical protein